MIIKMQCNDKGRIFSHSHAMLIVQKGNSRPIYCKAATEDIMNLCGFICGCGTEPSSMFDLEIGGWFE